MIDEKLKIGIEKIENYDFKKFYSLNNDGCYGFFYVFTENPRRKCKNFRFKKKNGRNLTENLQKIIKIYKKFIKKWSQMTKNL